MIVGNYTYTTKAASTSAEVGIAPAAGLRLMEISFRETTGGGAATFDIRHGSDASGPVMAVVNVPSGGSDVFSWLPQGLPCAGGLFLDRLTGETEINLTTTIL